MSHDPRHDDVLTAGQRSGGAAISAPPLPTGSSPGPDALDVKIRNLRGGQSIEMDVCGRWSEDAIEERLLRFISVRQPAVLHLNVDASGTQEPPLLTRARAAIEEIGGSLTVAMTSFEQHHVA